MAGFLVYELTSDPATGVVVVCLKFGLADWRTGFWVRSHDPNPRRSLAVFWTALACGLFRVGMIAVLGWFVLIGAFFLAFVLGLQGVVLAEQFYAILSLLGAIVWPFVAVCLIAVAAGLRAGVPLWYGSDTRRAFRARVWPPSLAPPGRPIDRRGNELVIPMLAWPTASLLAASIQFPGFLEAINRGSDLEASIRIPLFLGILAAGYGLLAWAGPRLTRLVALEPSECWTEATDEPT